MRRCLIADDHPGVVRALSELLSQSGWDVVATAADGEEALEAAASSRPDCAVVDYRMPALQGGALLESLRRTCPEATLVVYTGEGSPSLAVEAINAGANAVVLKDAPLGDVLRAIEASLRGEPYVDMALPAPVETSGPVLSGREAQVLAMVADGREYADIAESLGIGVETCRTHLKKACLRLGVATRTAAVAKALRLGLIS